MKHILIVSIVLFIPMFGLGQIIASPQNPQPSTFQPVLPQPTANPDFKRILPLSVNERIEGTASDKNQQIQTQQLQRALNDQAQVANNNRELQQLTEEAQLDFARMEQDKIVRWWLDTTFGKHPVINKQQYEVTKSFWDALIVLSDMQQEKRPFSITEAVFTIENAYYKGKLQKDAFMQSVQVRAELCKQIIKREQLNSDNDLAKNFAIQKLYQQENIYRSTKDGKAMTVPKLEYDFNDFMGDSSHTQMFVSKVMATGKGQCHSMPLLYLCIAEQLGAKAYLSLAPEHSFIRFADDAGIFYNFEATKGKVVSDKWLLQSGYINAAALRNKIYLDTLSQKQLLSLCFLDLAMAYQFDNGYDAFTEAALKGALKLNPGGIQQHIMFSNFWAIKMFTAIKYFGIKSQDEIQKYPIASTLQKRMLKEYEIIDRLGYQQMPKEAYQKWLKSIDEQRERQIQEEFNRKQNISR